MVEPLNMWIMIGSSALRVPYLISDIRYHVKNLTIDIIRYSLPSKYLKGIIFDYDSLTKLSLKIIVQRTLFILTCLILKKQIISAQYDQNCNHIYDHF